MDGRPSPNQRDSMASGHADRSERLILWPITAGISLTTLVIIGINFADFHPLSSVTQLVFLGSVLLTLVGSVLLFTWIICGCVHLFQRRFHNAVSFLLAIIAIPAVGYAEVRAGIFDFYLWDVLLHGQRLAAATRQHVPSGVPVCAIIETKDVSVGMVGSANVFTRLVLDDEDEVERPTADRTRAWRERCAAITDMTDEGARMSLSVEHLLGHFYLIHLYE